MIKPPGPIPDVEIVEADDGLLYTPYDAPDGWIRMGIAPEPRTPWQTFWYHVGHGLCMQYDLIDVLVFAWRHRHRDDK